MLTAHPVTLRERLAFGMETLTLPTPPGRDTDTPTDPPPEGDTKMEPPLDICTPPAGCPATS